MSEWIGANEAMRIMGVSRQTLSGYVKNGTIRTKRENGRYAYSLEDAERVAAEKGRRKISYNVSLDGYDSMFEYPDLGAKMAEIVRLIRKGKVVRLAVPSSVDAGALTVLRMLCDASDCVLETVGKGGVR